MSKSEVLDKFHSNAKSIISEKQSEELIAAVLNFAAVEDVSRLVSLLRPA